MCRTCRYIEFGRLHLNKFPQAGHSQERRAVQNQHFARVENGIDDLAMADSVQAFAGAFHKSCSKRCGKEIICIDGKAERGTVLENGRNPDIVSAYSFNTGIILATRRPARRKAMR